MKAKKTMGRHVQFDALLSLDAAKAIGHRYKSFDLTRNVMLAILTQSEQDLTADIRGPMNGFQPLATRLASYLDHINLLAELTEMARRRVLQCQETAKSNWANGRRKTNKRQRANSCYYG